jgi:dipeptidyl-peptidase-4
MRVLRADGTTAGELPSVAEKPPFQTNLEIGKLGGFWTTIVRPRVFDKKKKYPVILQVYGGPTVNVVYPYGFAYIADQWIADHGFIVVSADNRGTPGRGRDWERAMKDAFATVPHEDQVKALQAMGAHEPAMDLTRVGVMGGSFGGFMAALAVMRRPDVFKAGVADAPVVDWKNYDTAYTERYLGVPPPAGRSESYEENGLLPYVKNLSRPLLVIHGTADDNVHFSESLLLMDAVFRAGKSEHMELMPMVGLTHMFNDPAFKIRYYQRIFGFFQKNLK